MRDGSYLAVLDDGTHRVATGVFATHRDWHEWLWRHTSDFRHRVVKFVYAWGHESQTYTAREFREVFHGE